MSWKCPDCGKENIDQQCQCGYAYYRILGVKPDAMEKEVRQAYKYLMDVWQYNRFSQDEALQSRARERLGNIRRAYEIFRSLNPETRGVRKITWKVVLPVVSFVLLLLAAVLLWALRNGDVSEERVLSYDSRVENSETDISRQLQDPGRGENRMVLDKPVKSSAPRQMPVPDIPISSGDSAKTEEKVKELVKKSYAINSSADVETLMAKWAEKHWSHLQIAGWIAKQIDDNTYLVSYTATDGLQIKGFYFEVELQTGQVRHIGDNPELQQKYGIKYN